MAKKPFKRKPTNKKIEPPANVVKANEQLKKRQRHIECSDAGQPGKFIKLDLKKIYRLCVLGMTNQEIAELYDIKEETFRSWVSPTSKTFKPELADTLQQGREDIVAKVADRLVQRALGYKHVDTKMFYDSSTGEIITQEYIKHYPPSEVAGMYILNNRRPKNWSNKQTIEGPDGGPVVSGPVTVNVLTSDDKIAKLLKDKEAATKKK